jgi:hypothetical protein
MRARHGINQCNATEVGVVTFNEQFTSSRERLTMLRSISPIACLNRCQRPCRALRRQFEPAREAFEQAETELFHQPANAMTDRVLRQMLLTRDRGEAQMPASHDNASQCIE